RHAFDPTKRSLEWRRTLGIDDNEIVVSFVGRIVMEKGLDRFVAALEELKRAGVEHRALVVGDGPAKAWLEQRLPDAVFTGYLDGAALACAYASADVFLNPSTTETFGNVTAEAMASGLPAVCADATGSRSLVVDGKTGFLVPADDTASYAAALARLITNGETRARMGDAARERSKFYDWDTVLRTVLQHYL
ncbi:MAG: glycosyltransferase, partial [Rhodospirillaceae bacterium]